MTDNSGAMLEAIAQTIAAWHAMGRATDRLSHA